MEMSVDSKSLSESVDDLMPNTVDEASRRRSNPQDEMQRILAYNAQIGCKRTTPKRAGTGRQITMRPVEFRKRVVAAIAPLPSAQQVSSDTEETEQKNEASLASLEIVVRRGRRTGVRVKRDVPKDDFGLERLSEFWDAEEQSTRLSVASASDSAAPDGSMLSQRLLSESGDRADSFADSRSVETSTDTQMVDNSDVDGADGGVSDESCTPASTIASSHKSLSAQSRTSATPASSARSSSLRSSVARSSAARSSAASAASSLLDSPSDTKLLGDSPSGGLDASKQRLTFGSSDKRLSTLSTDSISPSESEKALKRRSRVSFADSGNKRKSSVSFAKTPKGCDSSASAATQSPVTEHEDEQEEDMDDAPSPMQDSGAGEMDDGDSPAGSPNLDSSMVDPGGRRASEVFRKAEELRSAKREKSRKRQVEDGRMPLVDRHETMGRASYCETDSYAPKASRLSEIAPRPNLEDDGKRRSKRRKIRPLQYWRGERIEYARAPSAAVPEVVDLTIRSPEATPWRRKPPKSQLSTHVQDSGPTSTDSKAKTVRKGSKASKGKGRTAATKVAAPKASTATEGAGSSDKETAPLNKSAASKVRSVPPAPVAVSVAKPQIKKRTPFFIFCTEKRSEVREAHPDMAITEQAKILGRMWGALPEDEKMRYQHLSATA